MNIYEYQISKGKAKKVACGKKQNFDLRLMNVYSNFSQITYKSIKSKKYSKGFPDYIEQNYPTIYYGALSSDVGNKCVGGGLNLKLLTKLNSNATYIANFRVIETPIVA